MKHITLLAFISTFLVASLSMAFDLEADYSGRWKFELEGRPSFEVVLIKSTMRISMQGSDYPLYYAKGNLGDAKIWAASFMKYANNDDSEPKTMIYWQLLKDNQIDGESNIILSTSTKDELRLGGDFEEEELAKMTRIVRDEL